MADDQNQPPEETESGPPPLKAGVEDAWLAENIREARESLKMSQGELARRMRDLDYRWWQQTVRRVEEGTRNVVAGEAAALARILGTSVTRLMMPGRKASTIALLDTGTARAGEAWEQVESWTAALAAAQRQLARTVAETEEGEFADDPEVAGALADARQALGLTAAGAVESGLEDREEPE